MTKKLKRDQLAPQQVKNWRKSFKEEAEKTFNLKIPKFLMQKETYAALIGENENRVRIYLGLEQKKEGGKHVLCAYAVSAFLMGSSDVYKDYETPVFKLEKENANYSDNTKAVIEGIQLYRKWRAGELDPDAEGAAFRQYIYPNAYLLTKYELHELFVAQKKDEILLDFGISKTMNVMLSAPAAVSTMSLEESGEEDEVFDYGGLCPPDCDEGSIYNS